MGFLDLFRKADKRASLQLPPGAKIDYPDTWPTFGGTSTSSGVYVDAETSLTYSAVWAAVRLLADSISSLPFSVIDKSGSYRKVLNDHRLSNLIHTEPNPMMTSKSLRWVLVAHANLYGNGYARLIRDEGADVVEIRPIHPENVEIVEKDYKIYYKVKGVKVPYDSSDIIHIKAFTLDGVTGLSPITYAREAIGSGIAAQNETGKMFKSGANVNGVLEAPGMPTADQVREIKAAFKKNSKDGIAVLFGGMKYNRMSMSATDAQWIEQRKLTIEDVARIFRVPPHLIGELSRSTMNNIEHQSIEFVQFSLMPWAVEIEQEFGRKIFRTTEKNKLGVKLNMNALLRGDQAARGEWYSKMKLAGNLTTNEIRELEDLKPIGPDGDIMIFPVNTTTMDKLNSDISDSSDNQDTPHDEGNENI